MLSVDSKSFINLALATQELMASVGTYQGLKNAEVRVENIFNGSTILTI